MADPISLTGLGGISGDLPRRKRSYTPKRRRDKDDEQTTADTDEVDDENPKVDPNAGLIEALDRLRATGTLGPVESELVRAIRGSKHYKEEDSRTGLPIIHDPEAHADPNVPPPSPSGNEHLA